MYTPSMNIRAGLNDPQRETLTRFEQIDQPSDWMRGQLSAIRMCATSDDDRQRVEAVQQKWSSKTGRQS